MPGGMRDSRRIAGRALADGFAFYARHRLGEHAGPVSVAPEGDRLLTGDASILVAVGDWEDAHLEAVAHERGLRIVFPWHRWERRADLAAAAGRDP